MLFHPIKPKAFQQLAGVERNDIRFITEAIRPRQGSQRRAQARQDAEIPATLSGSGFSG